MKNIARLFVSSRLVSILLLACLFMAGCASGTYGETAPSASIASAALAAGGEAAAGPLSEEEILSRFCAITLENLVYSNGKRAELLSSFTLDDGTRGMMICYPRFSDETGAQTYAVWLVEDNDVVLVFSGKAEICGISYDGNAVAWEYDFESEEFQEKLIEYIDGEEKVIATRASADYFSKEYHSLADDRKWTALRYSDSSQELYREITYDRFIYLSHPDGYIEHNSFEGFEDLDLTPKVEEFWGVVEWAPSLPEGAPAWVGDLIGYMHNQFFFSYRPDEVVNLAERGVVMPMKLTYPMVDGGGPIITGSMYVNEAYMYAFEGGGDWGRGSGESSFEYYTAENGATIMLASSYEWWGWNVIKADGPELLFFAFYNTQPDDPQIQFQDVVYTKEEIGDDHKQWLEQKFQEALANLGYGTLEPMPAIDVNLPEYASWNELEAMLVDAFCSYANHFGQMEYTSTMDLLAFPSEDSSATGDALSHGTYLGMNEIFTDLEYAPQVSFFKDGRYEMVVNYLHGMCTLYGTYYVEGDTVYAQITNWNNSPVEGFMPSEFDFTIIDSNNIMLNQGYYGVSPGDTFRLVLGEA